VRRVTASLERWGWDRGWVGPDPYEGLNATRRAVAPFRRSASGRRLLIQAVKRSPIDLRGALGIEPEADAAGIAQAASGYCRAAGLTEELRSERVAWAVERLERLRMEGFERSCWGYHFDVETRFFNYPRTRPNTIATAFAAFALLDAHDLSGDARPLELAREAARFFAEDVRLTDAGEGTGFFGYFPGDRTPIHNSSLFAAAVLAGVGTRDGDAELLRQARSAVEYTLARQAADGSWLYAETPNGAWVDGYHTGYLLDALLRCELAGAGEPLAGRITAARTAGLVLYATRLIEPDGGPRHTLEHRYPLDCQAAAQAIHTFAWHAGSWSQGAAVALEVFDWALARMLRPDGAFAFQRGRRVVNRVPHVRWVEAPMFDALGRLAALSDSEESG
jgi:hypothetical protein